MILLALFFPYIFYIFNGRDCLYLPAYLTITYSLDSATILHYNVYELLPTLIYYFGISLGL